MTEHDIFELVGEVEKQKKASIDDIYQMLDEAQNEDSSVVDVKAKVHSTSESLSSLNYKTTERVSTRVHTPVFPQTVTFDTRFDCFKALLEGVDYGQDNNYEYVSGHKQALEDVYKDAFNNQRDLYVTEARVNDEINRTISKTTLAEKGYYDGLMYALKAIRKSKTMMMDKIVKILNSQLMK